jgi:hypothetical protein
MAAKSKGPKIEQRPCRLCDLLILWAVHESTGKRAPFDPEPAKGYELTEHNGTIFARYTKVYTPHHATCMGLEQNRRRKRGEGG